MKKFLLALLTAVTAAALFCGAAASVATYSASYDAPAGINAIVVQDNSAAVVLQADDRRISGQRSSTPMSTTRRSGM